MNVETIHQHELLLLQICELQLMRILHLNAGMQENLNISILVSALITVQNDTQSEDKQEKTQVCSKVF